MAAPPPVVEIAPHHDRRIGRERSHPRAQQADLLLPVRFVQAEVHAEHL